MTLSKNKATILLLIMLFSISCGKESSGPGDQTKDEFDKSAMLINYADNLIIPAYTSLQEKMPGLEIAVNTFLTNPNTSSQLALKIVFKDAYLQVERISVMQFGPAESVSLNSFINMLPANTTKKVGVDKPDLTIVEENITSGNYNLVQNSAFHQQGFPVLDFLLFSDGAINKFTGSGSTNRKKYVQDLLTRIKDLVNQTLTSWKGNYRGQFIANTKSDTGSPISFLVNQFAFEMDMIKGPRIGWPFGSQSGGIQYPDKCEGYYSGISLDLAIENMMSLKNMYSGGSGGNGIAGYLSALGKTKLNGDVLNQFDIVINKLKAIPAPLSASLSVNKPAIQDASKEIQTLLTLIKTDVVSALGVQISYVDNDGD